MSTPVQYAMALGAFRQQSAIWSQSARVLAEVARAEDPSGSASDDPAAVQIYQDILAEFRAVAVQVPGIRQLFANAIGGA